MMKLKIVLFRYAPGVIKLTNIIDENTVVLVPSSQTIKYDIYEKEENMLARIIFIDDYVLPNIVREIKKLQKEGNIESITTLSEEDMIWSGLLHDHFVLNNTAYVSNTLFKDKYLMRSFLIDEVNQPFFRLLEDESDVIQFWEKAETDKAVIKPRIGAGSESIVKLNRNESLQVKDFCNGNFLIEEFIAMENMLTCDGYAIDSQISRFFSHEYEELLLNTLHTSKEFTVRTNHLYTTENKDILYNAFRESQKVLHLFAVEGELTPFHFEWFYEMKSGTFYFCEVGKRFGGASIPRLVELAFGVDLLKEYWQIHSGKEACIINTEAILFPSQIAATYSPYRKQGVLTEMPLLEAFNWTDRTTYSVAQNQSLGAAKTVMEGLFTSVFVSRNEIEYQQNLSRLRELSTEFIFQ